MCPSRVEGRDAGFDQGSGGRIGQAIHGDAFQRQRQVTAQHEASVILTLENGDFARFGCGAQVTYQLTPAALRVHLDLTSRAPVTLPFGLGFHPWFPRNSHTKLHFQATGHWPEDSRHLPSTTAPVARPARLNVAKLAALPVEWINAGFAQWAGFARIARGPVSVSVTVKADLSTAILFFPSSAAGFFCFEPVSHPVDAHNLPGMPGLTLLASGETLTAEMTLDWT